MVLTRVRVQLPLLVPLQIAVFKSFKPAGKVAGGNDWVFNIR